MLFQIFKSFPSWEKVKFKIRQDKTRQNKTRQDKTRQQKTGREKNSLTKLKYKQ